MEEADEEEDLGQGVKINKIDKEEEILEDDLTIKDTLIVFVNTEIIIYDFNKTTGWYVGDLRDNI